jgi:hypothetical protein
MALVFVHFDRWFFAIHALVAIPYLTFLTCYWFPVEAGLSSWIRHLLYTGTFLGAFRYLGLVLTGEYPIDLFYLFGAIAGVNFVALYFVALRLCRQPLKLYGVALLFVPYVWLLTFSFQVAVVRYRKAERRKFIA